MSKKNSSRPYNNVNNRSNRNISKNRPVKYNKDNNEDKKKNLENTTRIRIDEGRINDLDTLDTSFLEGRLDKKAKEKYVKEKLLMEKKKLFFDLTVIKKIFMLVACLSIVVLVILVFINHSKDVDVIDDGKEKVVSSEKKKVIDDNYVFVGDFYTEEFNFDELDYHYVKVAEKDLTTNKLLDDLKKKVYQYNPSVVFIQLGINDLKDEKPVSEIIDNLEETIEKIKDNRPYTRICLESLYPINKDHSSYDSDKISDEIDNEKIKEVNKKIRILSEKYDVEYFDVFSLLSRDGKLDDDYTEDGLKINPLGYEKILEEINKIVG